MVIRVVGKQFPKRYRIVCTDRKCRNIIEFDFDDVQPVPQSSMGRNIGSVNGITCPDCNEVLALKDATLLDLGK